MTGIQDLIQKVAGFYRQPNKARMGQVNQFIDKNIPIPVVNPLAKMAGNVLFGNQIQESDLGKTDRMMSLAMGISGGMKDVGVSNQISKRIANLLIEKGQVGRLGFDAMDELVKLTKQVLKVKPKEMKFYGENEMLQGLAKKITDAQKFAHLELPMQNMSRGPVQPNPDIIAGAKSYLRGMGGKFQGSLPRSLNINTSSTQPKGVGGLNIPKLF